MTAPFRPEFHPSTSVIRDAFADEVASLGGTVTDVFEDGERLYARGVLATAADVRPGDTINGGVALRVHASQIEIHPYILRQMCINGAIMTYPLQSRSLERFQSTEVFVPSYDVAVTISAFRDAVRAGASGDAFVRAATDLRSMLGIDANVNVDLFHAMRASPTRVAHMIRLIQARFNDDGDRSAFGLMNAVTSVARDTGDPETRWALEQLAGMMLSRMARERRTSPAAAVVAV